MKNPIIRCPVCKTGEMHKCTNHVHNKTFYVCSEYEKGCIGMLTAEEFSKPIRIKRLIEPVYIPGKEVNSCEKDCPNFSGAYTEGIGQHYDTCEHIGRLERDRADGFPKNCPLRAIHEYK